MNEIELIKTTLKKAESTINDLPYTDRAWTQEIMTRLCKTGQEHNCHVRVSRVDNADGGEWLYDMTWLQYNERRQLSDVKLVLECEWDYFRGVCYDFEKLLLAKAHLRCMIFWADNQKQASNYIHKLIDGIQTFQKRGSDKEDKYFFCVWLEDKDCFYFHIYPSE